MPRPDAIQVRNRRSKHIFPAFRQSELKIISVPDDPAKRRDSKKTQKNFSPYCKCPIPDYSMRIESDRPGDPAVGTVGAAPVESGQGNSKKGIQKVFA